jgi:hypothetical protein
MGVEGDDMGSGDPDMGAPATLGGQLVATNWYALFELASDPESTGPMLRAEFDADGSFRLHSDQTTSGDWAVDGEKIQLTNLDNPDTNTWTIDTVVRDGRIEELLLPLGNRILRFAPPSEPAALQLSDIEGLWQSTEKVTGDMGRMWWLVLRVNSNREIEYGLAGDRGNFIGIQTQEGTVTSFEDGKTFWHFVPPIGVKDRFALAGEIIESAEGVEIYALFRRKPPGGQEMFFSIEMEPVDSLGAP